MNPLLKIAALTGLTAATTAQAFNWTLEAPTSVPSTRERTATGTDGTLYYMYGGQNGSAFAGLDELWSYDGTTWTMLTGSGASAGTRVGAVGGYDVARGKFVVFGGTNTNGVSGQRDNDTWEWDATNGWVNVVPAGTPGSPDGRWLVDHGVYVPGLGILFHGGNAFDATGAAYTSNETWAWTGGGWALLSNAGPTVRQAVMEYRSGQGDLILHGGQTPDPAPATTFSTLGETWRFDLGTLQWTQLSPGGTIPFNSLNPAQGLFSALSYYNPLTGMMIVHGGNGGNASNKTWQFDGTDWTEITTNGVSCRNGGMRWMGALGKAVYGPCNETNGTRNRTRSHGPQSWGSFSLLGTDCPVISSGLTAGLSTSSMPAIGRSLDVNFTNPTPSNLPVVLVGLTTTAPLPLNTIFPGSGASCSMQISPAVLSFGPSWIANVPNSATFVGMILYAQGGQLDPTSVVANTQYAEIVLGEF